VRFLTVNMRKYTGGYPILFSRVRTTLLLLSALACGESSTDVIKLSITIEPQGGLIVGVGGTVDFLAAVTDESGQLVSGQNVIGLLRTPQSLRSTRMASPRVCLPVQPQ